MFSHAARHLLLRRAPAVKLKIPTTRAHSTFNHRAFVGRGLASASCSIRLRFSRPDRRATVLCCG